MLHCAGAGRTAMRCCTNRRTVVRHRMGRTMKLLIAALALAALIAATQSAAAASGDRRDVGQPGQGYDGTYNGYPLSEPRRRRGFVASRPWAAGRPRNLEDTRARGAAMKTIATGYATIADWRARSAFAAMHGF